MSHNHLIINRLRDILNFLLPSHKEKMIYNKSKMENCFNDILIIKKNELFFINMNRL